MIYAGSSRLTCFLETLARFRKAPASLEQALEEISDYVPSDYTASGTVPESWLTKREMGRAALPNKRFADIYSSLWVAHLRNHFEQELVDQGVIKSGDVDFDLSLLLSQRRPLTQKVARHVYDLKYDGIRYQSRHGSELENWAVFEPFDLKEKEYSQLRANDPDFQEALATFKLTFDPNR